MADPRINVILGARDEATKVVTGLRGQFERFKQDAVAGFGLGAGISAFNLLQRGVGAVVDVIGDAVKMAAEEEASIGRMTTAIKANDAGWDGNVESIERVISARERLAFNDQTQRDSLALLVAATKDVAEAQELQAVAMDLSRLRGTDLVETSTLLSKVYAGNLTALKRFGISLGDVSSGQEALTKIQQLAAGQAAAYADTTQGKLVIAQQALENAMEDLGSALLPVMADLATFAADVIPGVVDGLQGLLDDTLKPLLDAIQMSDPQWAQWTDKIREAGVEAGMTSTDIQALTDTLKITYDAGRRNTEGLEENARQMAVNRILTDLLDRALADYNGTTFEGADNNRELAKTEAEIAAEAKRVAAAIGALAKQSFPELRDSSKEALGELRKSLEAQGDPLKFLQKETMALNAIRRQAAREERWDIVASVDARLDEIKVIKQGWRAMEEAEGKAKDLHAQTSKDYGIDIDVDTSELDIAAAKVAALGAMTRSAADAYTDRFNKMHPEMGFGPKPDKGGGDRRRRIQQEREALDELTRGYDDVAESADKAAGSTDKKTAADERKEKAAKEAEAAEKVLAHQYDLVGQAAAKVAEAVEAIGRESFKDMAEQGAEHLAELRASLEAGIVPILVMQQEVANLRALRAEAEAAGRWDIVAAIDLRLQELEVMDKQYRMMQKRYTEEHSAVDILTAKLDIGIKKAKELLEVYRTQADVDESVTDAELARMIVKARQGRAAGGPVSAGGAYLVGERGPEMLVMGRTPGNIVPNTALGGGGDVYLDGYLVGKVIDERLGRQYGGASRSGSYRRAN